MKKILFLFGALSCVALSAQVVVNDTFLYTGSMQIFTVPACVTTVTITAYGAQGQDALVGGATGGLGGSATGELVVSPSQVLNIFVGGQNGYNGGGQGGINGNDQSSSTPIGTNGGYGGGASDVRFGGITINDRILVAGGGGGAGHNGVWQGCQVAGPGGNGGSGGGTTGSAGTAGVGTPCNCGGGGGDGGTGGTQTAGGIHGNYAGSTACLRSTWGAGSDGTLAQGGAGSQISFHNGSGGSGGGGGGYYGGGSGGQGSDTTPGGGGGGGSSFTGSLTSAATTAGVRSGDGMIIISYSVTASLPPAPANLAGTTSLCPGATAVYTIDTVAGATNYTWTVPSAWTIQSGQGTASVNVLAGTASDTIWVYATNVCGDGPASMIVVTVLPEPTVDLGADTANCGPVVLTADSASAYMWCDGSTTQTVTANMTGMYCVTIVDSNGCAGSDSIIVTVNQDPVVVASAAMNSVCIADDTVQLSGSPAGGTWSGPCMVNADQFDPSACAPGMYDLVYTYTDSLGCTGMDTTTITSDLCLSIMGTDGVSFSVYPNPASVSCVITFSAALNDVRIAVTDLQGRTVQTQNENDVTKGKQATVNLENLSAGTYMLNVISAEGTATRTLIIQ